MFCRLRRTNHERLLLQNKRRQYIRQATFWTTYAEDLRCGSLPFSIESLKNLGVHLANLRRDLWVECTLLYSAGRVIHLRQQRTLWIQNCRTSIHPSRTKNKSYNQRKIHFLKQVEVVCVKTKWLHTFCTTIFVVLYLVIITKGSRCAFHFYVGKGVTNRMRTRSCWIAAE